MRTRQPSVFATVRSEGALLPPDLLQRVVSDDASLGGLTPEAYHLPGHERLSEAISRSWSRLLGAWEGFQGALGRLPGGDPGTSLTRERWSLVLFDELGYGRLLGARALEVDGRSYPVSHLWGTTPIHLVGARLDLDRRAAGVAGAARTSPHGLVQELLNRSKEHRWGIVSNGLRLRILRDSASLTRQAFVEFDLEAMMQGEVYADFSLLWLLCHESRVEAEDGRPPWLERWAEAAKTQGTRALDTLRDGVQRAIEALGRGFLAHPDNASLRGGLKDGSLDKNDYFRELLRLVYRLIFLFVAEDRELLLAPDAPEEAKERFRDFYSTGRLRGMAERLRGTKHPDAYEALKVVMDALGRDEGRPELGLSGLGSLLWSPAAIEALDGCRLANADLLEAVRALAFVQNGKLRRAVDYRNMGSEELGSVYESLLELHPEVQADAAAFSLTTAGGNERKTTGSYYTPTSLITELLNSALDPVLEEATRRPDPGAAILGLKVLDPAVGSGHFLVAAAHRIARRLAQVRTQQEEPSPEDLRTALRDVIGRCLYGIDVNPMAVELCKVSLWMEAMDPGKPLSFLDHHVVLGNSLLGATPRLLAEGIPDEAFKPLEGDDRKVVSELKRRNKEERKGQQVLAFGPSVADLVRPIAEVVEALEAAPGDSPAEIHRKEAAWANLQRTKAAAHAKLVADAWCAAFVIEKGKGAPILTHGVLEQLTANPDGGDPKLKEEVARLAEEYRFLHPHLAFPGVFRIPREGEEPDNPEAGWSGGFDVVLGNPPWERVKLQEKEWFATRRPDIASAPNAAARKKQIDGLEIEDPPLHRAWLAALRQADGESHLIRGGGRYPLCGRGDVNTYAVFAELMRSLIGPTGRTGAVVPSGIATDDTTKFFFRDLVEQRALVSLFSFENEERVFASVHNEFKFCLLTLTGRDRAAPASEFLFFARSTDALNDPERRFALIADDFALLNPNTRTCPIFRTRRDAEITKAIYRRVPVLANEELGHEGNSWRVSFMAMFHMANDSGLFRTREQLEAEGWHPEGNVFRRGDEACLPLYEGKMLHQFDHRFGTYEGQTQAQANKGFLPYLSDCDHADPSNLPMARYWVPGGQVEERLADRWDREWLVGWRDITNAVVERTVIAAVIPRTAVGHKFPLALPEALPAAVAALVANLDSYCLDYVARQKLGGTSLTYFVLKQLPVLPPSTYGGATPWERDAQLVDWIRPRVLELTYTARDLAGFGKELGCDGPPFRWDPDRRALLRAELDAAFFHLYGIDRDDADYIMDTFPIVRRNDEKSYGEYRTKRLILEVYDGMSKAIDTGDPYQTILDPPPADPRVVHQGYRP